MFHRHNRDVTFVLIPVSAKGLLWLPEAISHASDGFHPGQGKPGGGEFRPQPGHVHIHGPGLDEPVLSPDQVEQLFPSEDPAGRAHESREKLELLRREIDSLTLDRHLEAVAVDLELSRGEVVLPIDDVTALAPPDHRPHPRHELARENGLVT
mgnify:CR=1 FL=1